LAKAIGLVLEAVFEDDECPSPNVVNLTIEQRRDPSLILKSTCLDIEWTFLSLMPDVLNRNSTHSMRINMLKLFEHENGFVMADMLQRITQDCLNAKWEFLINDRWVVAKVDWPSTKTQVQTEQNIRPISATNVRLSLKDNLPYYITKLHYCSQVISLYLSHLP